MGLRTWIEENKVVEMLNVKYLLDMGMTRSRVRGTICQALDKLSGDVDVPPGVLSVLLNDEGNFYVLAVSLGSVGFVPIRTEARFWNKTGVNFDGDNKKLQQMTLSETGVIPIHSLKAIEDQIRMYPQITDLFKGNNEMRAILYDKPRGPNGYRSDYQLILNNRTPGLITIIAVIKGQTREIKSDLDHLSQMVDAAIQYIEINGKNHP